MAQKGQAERSAADYGREALAQWAEAARYGVRALRARRDPSQDKPSLKERLLERVTGDGDDDEGGGATGEEVKSGSGDGGTESSEENGVAAGNGIGAGAPLPIQGSIDVALPVAAVFDLCTRFEEYPQIVDRVTAIEIDDETHFNVGVRAGKREQQLSLELLDELPEERLDWEGVGELEHSGVLTFHPLAPRLTRLELTIERASEGPFDQLKRIVGLPERVLDQELRRFKAVAELWEDGKEYEPTEIGMPVGREESAADEEPEEDDEQEAEEDEQTRKGS
jgi:uncharacterized membrane protein